MTGKRATKQQIIDYLRGENQKLRAQVDELQRDWGRSTRRVEEMERDIDHLNVLLDRAYRDAKLKKDRIMVLNSALKGLRAQRAALINAASGGLVSAARMKLGRRAARNEPLETKS